MPKNKFDAFYYGVGMKLDEASIDQAGKQLEGKLNKVVDNVAKNLTTISDAVAKGVKDVDTKKLVQSLIDAQKELNQFQNFDPSKLQKQIDSLNTTVTSLSTSLGDVGVQLKNFTDDVSSRLSNIEIRTSKQGKDALKADLKEMKILAQGYSNILASGEKVDTSALDKYFQKIKDGFASLKASGNPMELFADKELAHYFVDLTNILRQMGAPVEDLRADFFELSSTFKGFFAKSDASGAQTIFKNIGYQIESTNSKLHKAKAELASYESQIAKLKARTKTTGFDIAIDDDKNLNFEQKIKQIQEYGDIAAEIDYGDEWAAATRNQIALIQAAEKELKAALKTSAGEDMLAKWQKAFGKYDLTDKLSTGVISDYVDFAQQELEKLQNIHTQIQANIKKFQEDIGRLQATEKATSSKTTKQTLKAASQKQKTDGVVAEVQAKIKINEVEWAKAINDALTNIETKGKVKPFKIKVEATQGKILEEIKKIKDAALVDKRKDGTSDVKIFNDRFDKFYKNLQTRRQDIIDELKQNWHPALKDAFTFRMELLGIDKKSMTEGINMHMLNTVDAINQVLETKPIQFHSNIDDLLNEIQKKVQDIKIDSNIGIGAGNIVINPQSLSNAKIIMAGGGNIVQPSNPPIVAPSQPSELVSQPTSTKKNRKSKNTKPNTIQEAEKQMASQLKAGRDIVENYIKLAEWAKALGPIAEGTDITIEESDFKNTDTIKRGDKFYTKKDVGTVIPGRKIAFEELDSFITQYEHSKNEEDKQLYGFLRKVIDVYKDDQQRLDSLLEELSNSEVVYNYETSDNKTEALATDIKSSYKTIMGKKGSKKAQQHLTDVFGKYNIDLSELPSAKTYAEQWQIIQQQIIGREGLDFEGLMTDLGSLKGNVGKTYENFMTLLKVSRSYMLASNSLSTVGEEASKLMRGSRAPEDIYRKEWDAKNHRWYHTDEKIGVKKGLIEAGIRQELSNIAVVFIDELGNAIAGVNTGKNIADDYLSTGNSSFTKIVTFLTNALNQAAQIAVDTHKRGMKGYTDVATWDPEAYSKAKTRAEKEPEWTSAITEKSKVEDYIKGTKQRISREETARNILLEENKQVKQRITELEAKNDITEEENQELAKLKTTLKNNIKAIEEHTSEINKQKARLPGLQEDLKNADGKNVSYKRGNMTVDYDRAVADLPEIQRGQGFARGNLVELTNQYTSERISAVTKVLAQKQAGTLSDADAKKMQENLHNIVELNKQLQNGTISHKDYVDKVTEAYILMRNATTEEAKAAAKADAKKLADATVLVKKYQEEEEILKEIIKTQKPKEIETIQPSGTKNKKPAPQSQPVVSGNISPVVIPETQDTVIPVGSISLDGLVGGTGLATAEKQGIIIDLLKNGIKISGNKTSNSEPGAEGTGKKARLPQMPNIAKPNLQAEEISKLTNINRDSSLYQQYEAAKKQLDATVASVVAKGKDRTKEDTDEIRALSSTVTNLGKQIINTANAFEQLKNRGGEAFSDIKSKADGLEDEMRELAHNDALNSNSLLRDISYDEVNQKLSYSLTDLEGNITRVTMAYNELLGVAIKTSDKTTTSASKIYNAIESEMTQRIGVNDTVEQKPLLGDSEQYENYMTNYQNMMDAQIALRDKGNMATQEEKNGLISLINKVKEARGEFERLAKASADFDAKIRDGETKSDVDPSNLEAEMKAFTLNQKGLTKSQKAMIEQTWTFKNAQDGATYSIQQGKGELASMSVVFDQGTKRIGQYTLETKKYKTGMEKFMDSLKGKWQEVARYLMTFGSMYRVFAILKQGVQYITEIDSALTELKKVTDETEETYDKFLQTAAKTADKVGSTIKEVVSSTADWARLGYSLEEAAGLAESTSVLLNVSEFQSIEDATNALTSTLQAFGYTAKESMNVVDVLNEVGNNFAISSDGIATALQDSASSLMAANNSYQEAVSLIAAANRVVQDPNSVGAALRTISLRLRGTSVKELEEAGEDTTGAVESTSKLRSKVKSLSGVDILTDTGAYKSTYEILLEISKVWENMSDIDQAALLEIIAGKTRSNTAAAILANTKDLEEAYKSAMSAEGSALEENEKYLDSIQGRIDLFNNAVQTMWSNALDSEIIKGIVDLGTELVKIIDKLGLFNTLLIGISSYAMIKNKMGPITFFKELLGLIPKSVKAIQTWVQGMQNVGATTSKLSQVTTILTQTQLKEKLMAQGLTDVAAEEIVVKTRLGKATNQLSEATLDATLKKMGYGEEQRKSIIQTVFDTEVTKENSEENLENAASNVVSEKAEANANNEKKENIALTTADNATTGQNSTANIANAGSNVVSEVGKGAGAKKGIGALLSKIGIGKAAGGAGAGAGAATGLAAAVPYVLAAVAVIAGAVIVYNALHESAEELREKLKEVQTEYDNVQSKIDSLNSELETTRDRMGELLALPTLSLTDQEELERLQKENDELERQIKLQEDLLKVKERKLVNSAEEYISSVWDDKFEIDKAYTVDATGVIQEDKWYTPGVSTKSALEEAFESYENNLEISRTMGTESHFDDPFGLSADLTEQIMGISSDQGLKLISDIIEKGKELYKDGEFTLEDVDSLLSGSMTDLKQTIDFSNVFNGIETGWSAVKALVKDGLSGSLDELEKQRVNIEEGINSILYDEDLENLEYGMSDEIDTYLDEIYAYRLKFKQIKGEYVKSEAISTMFDSNSTEEMRNLGKELQEIADNEKILDKNTAILNKLDELDGVADGVVAVDELGNAYNRLNLAMEMVGITAQDIADYFVLETGTFDSLTVEGIAAQYQKGIEIMEQLKTQEDDFIYNREKASQKKDKMDLGSDPAKLISEAAKMGLEFVTDGIINTAGGFAKEGLNTIWGVAKDIPLEDAIREAVETTDEIHKLSDGVIKIGDIEYNWDDLFDTNDEGEFEARADTFGEILKGMDEDARETFTNLAEAVANGQKTWDQAMSEFTLAGLDKNFELLNNEFESLNNEMFKGAADDINGLIDTVGELKAALDDVASTMDLVHTAQTQMNNSGRVSVKTALELMQSTEDWDKILTITNGTITLADGAEQHLIQTKLAAIKTQLNYAWQTAQTKLEVARATQTELDYAGNSSVVMTAESIKAEAIGRVSAVVVALGAAMDEIMAGNWGSVFSSFSGTYKNATATVVAQSKTLTTSISALEKDAENKKKMYDAFSSVDTLSEFKNNYDFDKTPGDKYDDSDSGSDDALEKLREKYENQIKNLDNQQTYLQNEVDRLEAENKTVSKSYYEDQIALEEKKLDLYEQEREALLKLKMTDEVADALWEVEHAIQESALRMVEFRQSIIDLYKTAFDDVINAYDNKDDFLSDQQNYIDKYRELMELQGEVPDSYGYQEQITNEEEKMADNISELNSLRQTLAEGMASGYIKEGSEEWIEMQDQIRATEEAILDNEIAIEEYRQKMKQLSVDAFELVRNAFSNKDNFLTNQQEYIQGYADLLEAQGIDVPAEIYDELIKIEQEKRADNVANLVDARQGLADIEAAGYTAADEEWQDAYQQVVELEKAVQDNDIAMAEYAKTIRDLDFEKFERFIGRLDDINSEIDNLRGLYDNDDVAFEDGTWTKEGITSLGLLYQQMEVSKQSSEEYAEKIDELNEAYKNGEMSEQEYYERLQELKNGQWDAINAYEGAKDAIVDLEEARIDMIEEGINKEIEAYEELIEVKKEELDAERDLYEFKKNIKEQTKDIASLERRIASLSGSTDASDVAERRKLEAELYSAQEGLNDTYYGHSKDQQSKALDDEIDSYKSAQDKYLETLRDTLKNTEDIINQKMSDFLLNADIVLDTLDATTYEHSLTLSPYLMKPWQDAAGESTAFKTSVYDNLTSLTNEDGIITLFGNDAKTKLESVFNAGSTAVSNFKTTVDTEIGEVKNIVFNSTSSLTSDLNLPWENATSPDSPISTFSTKVGVAINGALKDAKSKVEEMKTALTSPWSVGTNAVNTFSNNAKTALDEVKKKADEAATAISKAANTSVPSYTGSGSSGSGNTGGGGSYTGGTKYKTGSNVSALQKFLNQYWNTIVYNATGSSQLSVNGSYGSATTKAVKELQKTVGVAQSGEWDSTTIYGVYNWYSKKKKEMAAHSSSAADYDRRIKAVPAAIYAKGTLGTKKDEWAYTDEPWFGDEIVLVPGKNGNLQYMRRGTAVMPADISENLMEWGKINPDMSNISSGAHSVNLMSNYVSKPEINLSFEALVKADKITEDTLPEVKRFVQQEINGLVKQMNYALKGVGGR